jgi:hypothetical protein
MELSIHRVEKVSIKDTYFFPEDNRVGKEHDAFWRKVITISHEGNTFEVTLFSKTQINVESQ